MDYTTAKKGSFELVAGRGDYYLTSASAELCALASSFRGHGHRKSAKRKRMWRISDGLEAFIAILAWSDDATLWFSVPFSF